jgi:hypothetical protein
VLYIDDRKAAAEREGKENKLITANIMYKTQQIAYCFLARIFKFQTKMEEMIQSLSASAANVAQSLMYRDCAEALASDSNVLASVSFALEDVEARLAALGKSLAQEQQMLQKAKKIAHLLGEQSNRIKIMQTNLPARLPGHTCLQEIADNASNTKHKGAQAPAAQSKADNTPRIAYVRKDEFESVPLSTRGRITCDQVNACIDAFHTALVAKYKILHAPRAALGEPQMKRLVVYREQECDSVRGAFFLVEEDLRTLGQWKLDTVGKAALLVLRSLKRIRDDRSGGLHRHVI